MRDYQTANKYIGEKTVINRPELCNIYGPGTIGAGCRIGAYVEIGPNVTIGDRCVISAFAFIPELVVIGDDVFIGPHAVFCNDRYPPSHGDWKVLPEYIRVSERAVIGANATILPGIVIGKGAMVGAGAVVTRDVEDNTIVIGNPARPMLEGSEGQDADL